MQQKGGSQYGVPPPEMTPFMGIPGGGPDHLQPPPHQQQQPSPLSQLAEAASPISSRPPPPAGAGQRSHFEELVPGAGGNFPDDEALAAAGEEVERGGAPGNRWPRQETLALLKIRSEMDAAFRDATLKGPLWEDVSRKLAELGYKRSAKKCKEKFENVHKYYKRTRENRAGRQDGKTYRFFSQLEALHSPTTTAPNPAAAAVVSSVTSAGVSAGMAGPSSGRIQPTPISIVPPPSLGPTIPTTTTATATPTGGISFSSMSTSSESDESDDEDTEENVGSREQGKRKRRGGSGGGSRKMMAFFEGLMKQVMERQEAMQQRFLETIEKREQDRMIREEAWRRQEMARLGREQEILAQERAMASSRDAAVISFIQKISGQTIPLPTTLPPITTFTTISPTPYPASTPPPPPPPQQQQQQTPPQQHQQQKQHHHHQQQQQTQPPPPPPSQQMQQFQEQHDPTGSGGMETISSSSRWPKTEVHALIKLRSGLDTKYQEAGPKGPLWEEISSGMQRMGYSRSSKRCKEKWENINKYFKKVKESNKKRPEDAKTCPYFHQLDALYRKKNLGGGSSSGGVGLIEAVHSNPSPQDRSDLLPIMAAVPQASQQPERESNNDNHTNLNSGKRNVGNPEDGGGSGGIQIKPSNGGLTPTLLEESTSGGGMAMNKPEDFMKELMEQRRQQAAMESYDNLDDPDSDVNMDQDEDEEEEEDDDDDDEGDGKMQYKIEFQRPNVSGGGGNAPTTTAATTGSFLAMV